MTVLSTAGHRHELGARELPLPEVTRARYDVQGTFARGGVGKILRAREPHLGRTVALKELRRGTDEDSRERFIREARLTARLQHPGIVPVYDAGCWPDGEPFFSMKLVAGRSFARRLRKTGSLGERLALLPHVLAVAEAIAYAHSERIIHRDLKPENILLGDFGETVVIDWGLAKDLGEGDATASVSAATFAGARERAAATLRERPGASRSEDMSVKTPSPTRAPPSSESAATPPEDSSSAVSSTGEGLTMTGTIMGTPAYMPPEQAIGLPVDERADVYALGAILYHVLGGRAPYTGDDSVDVLRRVTAGPPPPLRRVQRGVPDELRAIVDKAMAREPAGRYPTAREFAEDLRRFQTGKIVGAHRYTPLERAFRFVRRYRTALAVLAVLAIGGAISVSEIVREKNIANMQRAAAEAAQSEAETERRLADIHSDELTLEQARIAVERDPARAITLLAGLSGQFTDWSAARVIAADAHAQGLPTILRGHTSTVNDVAYTPDGASLFTSSDDNTIRRWSVHTGELERVYRGHEDEVWGVSVSADGRYLASSSKDRSVRLWDLVSGEVSILRGHEAGVFSNTFTPDSAQLATFAHDQTMRLWTLATGESRVVKKFYKSPKRAVSMFSVTPDGRFVAHEGEAGELLVTALRGEGEADDETRAYQPSGPMVSLSFSPDGRLIATVTEAGGLLLLERETGEPRPLPWLHPDQKLRWAGFTPDSAELMLTDRRGTLTLRDLQTQAAREFEIGRGITRLAFSPDEQRIALARTDGLIELIDRQTGEQRRLRKFNDAVLGLEFSPDGSSLAASSTDHTARVWPIAAPSQEVLRGREEPVDVKQLRVDPTGRLVASGDAKGVVHLHDRVSGRTVALEEHARAITAIAFSPDGATLVTASRDGALHLWDRTGLHLRALTGTGGAVFRLAFAPDGETLAAGDGHGVIRLFHTRDWSSRDLAGHDKVIRALAFSADSGTLASGSRDHTVRVWALRDDASSQGQSQSQILRGHDGPVLSLAFSHDGRTLASGSSDHTVRLWSTQSWAPRVLEVGGNGTTRVLFTADDSALITASREQAIRIWDTRSGTARAVLRGHRASVTDLSLALDGKTLASSSHDATVRLWDLETTESRVLAGHTRSVHAVAFSPDGRSVVSTAGDGTARIWDDDLPRDEPGLRRWLEQMSSTRTRQESEARESAPTDTLEG